VAVRFDAAADRLLISTDPLVRLGLYTIMGWFQIVTDLNALGVFMCLNDNDVANIDRIGLNSDGTTLRVYDGAAGANGTNLAVGTWYHIALTRDAAPLDGSNLRAYLNGVLDITLARASNGGLANTRFEIGAEFSGNSRPFNGRVAYVKAWEGIQLTATEILQEMNVAYPVRRDSLYGWWPIFPGSGERIIDLLGNVHPWTAAGTLTDEDPPPVSWGAQSYYLVPKIVVPVGGGEVIQPVKHRQQGTVFAPGYNDRPRSWNPI
jgi:hypothetical protein